MSLHDEVAAFAQSHARAEAIAKGKSNGLTPDLQQNGLFEAAPSTKKTSRAKPKPVWNGRIHPFADRFPMMPDEDIEKLAVDITANGLLYPLILDPAGTLLAGRNRLKACEFAGVAPKFEVHTGDPVNLIITENLQRRDLTQGQKAHLTVRGLSDSDNPEAGYTQAEMARVSGVPQSTIAEAVTVARYAPEMVDQVIAGRLGHRDAYAAAKEAKAKATAGKPQGRGRPTKPAEQKRQPEEPRKATSAVSSPTLTQPPTPAVDRPESPPEASKGPSSGPAASPAQEEEMYELWEGLHDGEMALWRAVEAAADIPLESLLGPDGESHESAMKALSILVDRVTGHVAELRKYVEGKEAQA